MRPFSYRLVDHDGAVTSGTDYTGAHASAADFAEWRRTNNPGLVEVAVWEGELADRPDPDLDRLRALIVQPTTSNPIADRNRAYAGAVAVDVFEPRVVA